MEEIDLPAFSTLQSTEQLQPLNREQWPQWAQQTPNFSGAWITPIEGSVAISTTHLSTSNVTATVDLERTSTSGAPLRYYRYLYIKMQDGRVFQSGPFKELEYERHRDERPSWLTNYTTTASSS
jgi:hypothetical protein